MCSATNEFKLIVVFPEVEYFQHFYYAKGISRRIIFIYRYNLQVILTSLTFSEEIKETLSARFTSPLKRCWRTVLILEMM